MHIQKSVKQTLLLFFVLLIPSSVLFPQSTEYDVKAVLIYKFINFIKWPETEKKQEFVIGVVSQNDIESSLIEVFYSKEVKGQPVKIISVENKNDLEGCSIVFIGSNNRERVKKIIGELKNKPVLTVASKEGYAQLGVNINFYYEGETISFEINEQSAKDAGLEVNYLLLDMARIVETDEGSENGK